MFDSLIAVVFLILLFVGIPVVLALVTGWIGDFTAWLSQGDGWRVQYARLLIKHYFRGLYQCLHHPLDWRNLIHAAWLDFLAESWACSSCGCTGEQAYTYSQDGLCIDCWDERYSKYMQDQEEEAYMQANPHCGDVLEHHITREQLTNIYGEPMQGYSCECTCGEKWVAGTVAYCTDSAYLCPVVRKNVDEAKARAATLIASIERKDKAAKAAEEAFENYSCLDDDDPLF